MSVDITASEQTKSILEGVELMSAEEEGLHAQEEEWETAMRDQGYEDAMARIADRREKGAEGRTPGGSSLLSSTVPPLAHAIEETISSAKSGKRGRRQMAVRYIEQLEPSTVAYLTAKVVLDGISQRESIQTVGANIAGMVEDEIRFLEFKREAKRLYETVKSKLDSAASQNYRHQRRVMYHVANKYGVELGEPWSHQTKITVGIKLLDLLLASTDLVTHRKYKDSKGRTHHNIVPTEETLRYLQNRNEWCALLNPQYMPMVVPPKEWTTPFDGGYRYALGGKLTMVKTRNKAYLEELRHQNMPVVYEALNSLGATSWKVNKEVYDVQCRVFDEGLHHGGLATPDLEEIPPKPENIEDDEQARKEWRRRAAEVWQRNYAQKSKIVQQSQTLWIAKKLVDTERFYFPYTLDFRGRAYPVPMFLQPQGSDEAKGLLRFADKKPLGRWGAGFLAIHGANCLADCPFSGEKLDKLSLEQRIDRIEALSERIAEVASDPIANDWWSDADCPWQFLAFCFEWAEFLKYVEVGLGHEFPSSIPAAMDGSCNGLQHYSAMLRDEVGGAATNLVPNSVPADIYGFVLSETEKILQEKIEDSSPLESARASAILHSGQVDRKMAKTPAMTWPYGAKEFGIWGQVLDELRERRSSGVFSGFVYTNPDTGELIESDGFRESQALARAFLAAIERTITKGAEAMLWLQRSSRVASAEGLPIYWEAPSGFPVMQAYPDVKLRKIKTVLAGETIYPRIREDKSTINKLRQANGIAPNFIHSLDAAAMMYTVQYASAKGATHYCMVHDSYATHAGDAEELFHATRNAFRDMYAHHDVLKEFQEQLIEQIDNTDQLPDIPAAGELNIDDVLESDFFFA